MRRGRLGRRTGSRSGPLAAARPVRRWRPGSGPSWAGLRRWRVEVGADVGVPDWQLVAVEADGGGTGPPDLVGRWRPGPGGARRGRRCRGRARWMWEARRPEVR